MSEQRPLHLGGWRPEGSHTNAGVPVRSPSRGPSAASAAEPLGEGRAQGLTEGKFGKQHDKGAGRELPPRPARAKQVDGAQVQRQRWATNKAEKGDVTDPGQCPHSR